MTKTPQWLPDGSGIDPLTIDPKTVVEVEWSNGNRTAIYKDERGFKEVCARDVGDGDPYPLGDGRIVRVFADVTPPRPDPRVEVVARALHRVGPTHSETCDNHWSHWCDDARAVLDALDTMDPDPDEDRGP
mgnify:FL=1